MLNIIIDNKLFGVFVKYALFYVCSQVNAVNDKEVNEDDDWEYVEEGPAEIIWKGNEIIVKKKKIRVPKKSLDVEKEKQVIPGN